MKQNAYDSETVNGYARIVSDIKSFTIVHSFDDIVKFLMKGGHHKSRRLWTFNLGYDRDAILKYLPVENLIDLLSKGETNYQGHELMVFGKKIFIIKPKWDKSHPIKFIDIAQFFATEPDHSLDGLSEKFLGEKKNDNVKIRNLKGHQKDWDMDEYIKRNEKELGEYCQRDSILTAKLAEKVLETGEKLFDIDLSEIVSSASIGEKLTIKHLNGLHNYPKMTVLKPALFAEASYHGGIFLTLQRGTFYNVYDLDINSAYPFWMIDLPHWSNGKFELINSSKEILPNDKYGWIQCELNCEWIPYKNGEQDLIIDVIDDEIIEHDFKIDKVFYPVGKRNAFITLLEYNVLKKYHYYVKIKNGFIWRQISEKYEKPFSWMKKMYEEKSRIKKEFGKTSMEYLLVKIALNGTYGKTAQKKGEGKLKNWFYASYITAGTRVQIIEFLHDNNLIEEAINIATDGTLLRNFDENILKSSNKLGEWEINKWDEVLVIGNGMLQAIKPDKSDTRMRGITNNRSYDIRHELQKHRYKNEFIPQISKRGRPIHVSEAIKHHKILSKEDINIWKKVSRTLRPASDTKRIWKPFINFDQLLSGNEKSLPQNVKYLEVKKLKKAHYYKCPKCGNKRLYDFWEMSCTRCGYFERQVQLDTFK